MSRFTARVQGRNERDDIDRAGAIFRDPAAYQSAIAMRVLQGLALGGEYGGAATYIAEHAPDGKRGVYTSWIQIFASAFGTVFEWHDFIFTRRWHRVAARRRSLENKVLK